MHYVTFTNADKGNTIEILPNIEYVSKARDIFVNNNIELLTQDSTLFFSKEINSITTQLTKVNIRSLKVPNPHGPILRGLPK